MPKNITKANSTIKITIWRFISIQIISTKET
jgi:hypothetical protein